MDQNVQLLAWNDCVMHGQFSSSGIRENAMVRVDAPATWIRRSMFMQAWAMEPGQRILKVHGDSQQRNVCKKRRCVRLSCHFALDLLSTCKKLSEGSGAGCRVEVCVFLNSELGDLLIRIRRRSEMQASLERGKDGVRLLTLTSTSSCL